MNMLFGDISSIDSYSLMWCFAFDGILKQFNVIVISAWDTSWFTVADPILHSVVEIPTLDRKPLMCMCVCLFFAFA